MNVANFSSHSMTDRLLSVVCLTFIALSIGSAVVEADEVPAFFLKIAKNVPRIGRSDKSDDFYLKTAKDIPRMRGPDIYAPETKSTSYDGPRHFSQLQKRMVSYYPPGDLSSGSWEHFPLSIEGPPELWRTLASYANDKYGSSSDGIDNELWQRDKRMDTSKSLM